MKSVTTGRVPIPVAICEKKTQSGKTLSSGDTES
jgi:hypothetical protein